MKKGEQRFPSSFGEKRSGEEGEDKEESFRERTTGSRSLDDAQLPSPSAPPIPGYVRLNADHLGSVWQVALLSAETPMVALLAETLEGTVQFVLREHEVRQLHQLLGLALAELGGAH